MPSVVASFLIATCRSSGLLLMASISASKSDGAMGGGGRWFPDLQQSLPALPVVLTFLILPCFQLRPMLDADNIVPPVPNPRAIFAGSGDMLFH